MAKSHKTNCYICKSCHEELQQKMTCVCCTRPMKKQVCKIYNKEDYNVSYFVVSQCLQHLPNSTPEVQYICISCDKALKQRSDENPLVPYHAKFLKALNQRPEYVCTCCHHMLFCKTVLQFHITDYDMNNEMVKACLSHQYVMKLHRHTSHENDNSTTHKWPQFVPDDVQLDNIYIMNEFICIRCRNSLRQKKTKDA